MRLTTLNTMIGRELSDDRDAGRNSAREAKSLPMPEAPRRLSYYSGQLLTPDDFEAEQSYLLQGRRSDNRHLHGWGVVCGLGVTPSGTGGVMIEPGLAIDGMGRQIVVPERREMLDPRQPIDDRGDPCGQPVDSKVTTICLAYAERPEQKDDRARLVRETYTLEVGPGRAEGHPRSPATEAVLAGSSAEVAMALCEAAAREACDPPDQCVPIATVDRRKGKLEVVMHPRRTLTTTDALLELILGLVQRVQALERRG